jgi:hypothetical protein
MPAATGLSDWNRDDFSSRWRYGEGRLAEDVWSQRAFWHKACANRHTQRVTYAREPRAMTGLFRLPTMSGRAGVVKFFFAATVAGCFNQFLGLSKRGAVAEEAGLRELDVRQM